MLQLYGQFLAT